MTEQLISLERVEEIANLFGSFDENIRLLEQELGVQVTNRDGALKVAGEAENVMLGVKAIEALLEDMDNTMSRSALMTPERMAQRPVWRRVMGTVLRLFAMWM